MVRDQEPLAKQLSSLIEEEFIIDRLLATTVLRIRCLKSRNREISSKFLRFLFAQLPQRICRVLVPKLLQLVKLVNNLLKLVMMQSFRDHRLLGKIQSPSTKPHKFGLPSG